MALSFDERSYDNGFWVNAAIGAVAAFVLSFIPFSTVLGGVVAAYLQKGTSRNENLRVGAAAGAISFIPMLVVIFGFGVLGLLTGDATGFLFFLVFGLFLFVLVGIYTVGLAAAGGVLAHLIWEEEFYRARSGGRPGATTESYEEAQY
ncbi:DUF5518 domain-containing protein [Haloarchaeobius sp. HRN-SO-5]|uniref:DUF5518 domain-containing protein n=1 Tax=Haloarchaeobius sp. HRN-SO-5 TaxID=3446118 RepID=UPI003EC0157E